MFSFTKVKTILNLGDKIIHRFKKSKAKTKNPLNQGFPMELLSWKSIIFHILEKIIYLKIIQNYYLKSVKKQINCHLKMVSNEPLHILFLEKYFQI